MEKNYKRTAIGCFLGIFNQAVITNITAILFIPFIKLYGLSYIDFGLLIGINFVSQLALDFLSAFLIDKISFRPLIIIASLLSCFGLILYAMTPYLFKNNIFLGIIISTIVFASSGGMLEVVLSPVIDNMPDSFSSKKTAMTLMHSFYAWGQVFCIIITSVSLLVFGYKFWNFIVLGFAIIPIICLIVFSKAPLDKAVIDKTTISNKLKYILSPFFIACMFAILLSGGTEVAMNQWVSTFVVDALGFSKATADLVGMCLFAVFLGIGRGLHGKFGEKFSLTKLLSVSSFFACILYLIIGLNSNPIISLIASILCGLAVSLLWPGTLIVASSKLGHTGAWLFAYLAISGDLGCSLIPTMAGVLAEHLGLKISFLILSIIPLFAFICFTYLHFKTKKMKDFD